MKRICNRCRKEIAPGQRRVDDPCCAAPDCNNLDDVAHYECLPRYLQGIEDDIF